MEDLFTELGASALGSRLRRLSDRLAADLAELYRDGGHGFEPRWYPLFRLLSLAGPLSVSEAASRLGITHASVSQIARSMVLAGVAESSRDPSDERRRLLSLNRRGRQLGRRLQPLWDDVGAAVEEITTAGGRDLLPLVTAAERALGGRSVAARVRRRRRARRLAGIRVAEFAPEHADAFAGLNLAWLRRYFEVEPADRRILGDPTAEVIDRGGAILMAVEGEHCVGTCALVPREQGLELAKMAVAEHTQGLGVGRLLLEAAIERARAMGAERLFLLTHTKLTAAVALCRKLGFVSLPEIPSSEYARVDLAMVLEL